MLAIAVLVSFPWPIEPEQPARSLARGDFPSPAMLHAHPWKRTSPSDLRLQRRLTAAHLEKTTPRHSGIELALNIRRGMNMGQFY